MNKHEFDHPNYDAPYASNRASAFAVLVGASLVLASVAKSDGFVALDYDQRNAIEASAESAPRVEFEPNGIVHITSNPDVVKIDTPEENNIENAAEGGAETEITTTKNTADVTSAESDTEVDNKTESDNQNIELGIKMAPPKRLTVTNPSGGVLIDVDSDNPYSGEIVGKNAQGAPLYDLNPPVALHVGDQRANYISWAGLPNTLKQETDNLTGSDIAKQDDNTIILSHSSNMPGVQLAFQFLTDIKKGAIATIETDEGVFVYQLTSKDDKQKILKTELGDSDFTWKPVKNDLVLITCEAAIKADGNRVPVSKERNIVVRMHLIAAKAIQN